MSKKPKITIKPFRHQVQMDPNYAENTWKLLKVCFLPLKKYNTPVPTKSFTQGAIYEIHKQNASGLSFEELYRCGKDWSLLLFS